MAINRLPTHSLLGLLVVLVLIAHASNASAVKNKPDAAKTAEDKREFLYRVPLVDKLPETVDDAARAKSVLEYLRWLHHRGQWSKKLQLAVHPGDGIITVHATEDLKVCYIASYPRRYIFSLPRAQTPTSMHSLSPVSGGSMRFIDYFYYDNNNNNNNTIVLLYLMLIAAGCRLAILCCVNAVSVF
jgi:hypothetical protein